MGQCVDSKSPLLLSSFFYILSSSESLRQGRGRGVGGKSGVWGEHYMSRMFNSNRFDETIRSIWWELVYEIGILGS